MGMLLRHHDLGPSKPKTSKAIKAEDKSQKEEKKVETESKEEKPARGRRRKSE